MRDYIMPWQGFLVIGGACALLLGAQAAIANFVSGTGTVTWQGECKITGGSSAGGITVECPHGDTRETDKTVVRAFVDAAVSGDIPAYLICRRREFDGAAPDVTNCEVAP